jgi:electron transfer flavoprotein beta subunit
MGEEVAGDQLRFAISMGVNEAILIESDGERDATAIAEAIVDTIRAEQAAGVQFDVLLFGNESADAGNYQVGVRVAYGLNLPCVTGVKALDIQANGTAVAKREIAEGWEVYELALPAVFTVKEGINLPRYPLLRGRLAAKRKEIKTYPALDSGEAGLEMVVFKTPPEVASQVQVVGKGPGAAQKVAKLMQEIGVL